MRTVLVVFFLVFFCIVSTIPAEGQKKTSSTPEDNISDATVLLSHKKAEQYLNKKDYKNALKLYEAINNYSEEILTLATFFKGVYDKALEDPNLPLADREEIFIKMKSLSLLVPKYESLRESSSFALGKIYAKKGDKTKAKKYLQKTIELTKFSMNPETVNQQAKTLLLNLLELEGAF